MADDIKIVEVTAEDTALLQEFCEKRNQSYLARKKIQRPRLLTLEQFQDLFQKQQVLGCLGLRATDGALVGGALLTRQIFRSRTVAYVSSVWTDPLLHGKGLGTRLIHELCKFAETHAETQKLYGMTAEIHTWNPGSIRIHEKNGFHIYYFFNNAPGNAYTRFYFRPFQPENLREKTRRWFWATYSYSTCLGKRLFQRKHPATLSQK